MVGKKVNVCNKEIGRPVRAFWARWEICVSLVSEEVQDKALECTIPGEDGGQLGLCGK